MRDESTLIHCEHVSARSFDEVVAAFRAAVGAADGERLRKAVEASTGRGDFEARMRASEGPSGFMLFLEADHGAWMARVGLQARAKLNIIGNPRIATDHDRARNRRQSERSRPRADLRRASHRYLPSGL